MIIIAGYSRTKNINERDTAVAAFADMVRRARRADGCLDVAISPTRSIQNASTSSNAGAISSH